MQEKRSYYSITPAFVRYDEDLCANAKLLYGEITALCNEKGFCWARNTYFAELYHVSNRSVSAWISQLIEKGYIICNYRYREGTKEIESRCLSIPQVTPNFNTSGKNLREGIEENFHTTHEENFQDNNTDRILQSNNDDSGGIENREEQKTSQPIKSFPLSKATYLYMQHAPSLYKREFDKGFNDDYKNAQALMQALDEGFSESECIALFKRAESANFLKEKMTKATMKWVIEKRSFIMAGKYDDSVGDSKPQQGERKYVNASTLKDEDF